jgi:hypothetical protein
MSSRTVLPNGEGARTSVLFCWNRTTSLCRNEFGEGVLSPALKGPAPRTEVRGFHQRRRKKKSESAPLKTTRDAAPGEIARFCSAAVSAAGRLEAGATKRADSSVRQAGLTPE